MSMSDWFQINYVTSDHISRPALTEFFSAIDAANRAGYMINHCNDSMCLMIHPDHLYDVADSLGLKIHTTPEKMLLDLKQLVWPRFLGSRKLNTSLWPSATRLTCWTFDISKSESDMTQPNPTRTIRDEAFNHLEDVYSLISVWRDTLLSLPPSAQVNLTAGQLSTVLSNYCEQLDLARTKF
jgi:hypothetical protein